jgi:hypothetical protein
MLFTPLLPSAGPTGGEGEAWPAPTINLTIWSFAIVFRAMVVYIGRLRVAICGEGSEVFGVGLFRRGAWKSRLGRPLCSATMVVPWTRSNRNSASDGSELGTDCGVDDGGTT